MDSRLQPSAVFSSQGNNPTNFRDLSDLEILPIALGGVTDKIVLQDGKRQLMLKFKKEKAAEVIRDYITEYIGSSIARTLGYSVQQVELAKYNGEECVAVELLRPLPTSFKGLGSSSADGVRLGSKGQNYNLQWLLELRMTSKKFNLSQAAYEEWVWRVFFFDMFIGNFDRHEGNWGFLKKDGIYNPSPLFDNGACFYPKFFGTDKIEMKPEEIKHLILFQTKCAIYYNDKKKNYFELLDLVLAKKEVRDIFTRFLVLVEKACFDEIFNYVEDYNPSYIPSVEFVKNVIKIRKGLLDQHG